MLLTFNCVCFQSSNKCEREVDFLDVTVCCNVQIPLVLHKEPDLNERGQQALDPDGRPRYRCGFRIGGGIDQDPTVSPQGYPDKVVTLSLCCSLKFYYLAKQLCLRGLGIVILSICLSVRPSVRLSHACFVTKRKNILPIF